MPRKKTAQAAAPKGSRKPDPINPLRGGMGSAILPQQARNADWNNKWARMVTVPLWQAVALSLNMEPAALLGSIQPNDAWLNYTSREFRDRLEIACDHLRNGILPSEEETQNTRWSKVYLRDFAEWAVTMAGWEVPPEFRALAEGSVQNIPANAVTISKIQDIIAPNSPLLREAETFAKAQSSRLIVERRELPDVAAAPGRIASLNPKRVGTVATEYATTTGAAWRAAEMRGALERLKHADKKFATKKAAHTAVLRELGKNKEPIPRGFGYDTFCTCCEDLLVS